jgi:hypothetical protein
MKRSAAGGIRRAGRWLSAIRERDAMRSGLCRLAAGGALATLVALFGITTTSALAQVQLPRGEAALPPAPAASRAGAGPASPGGIAPAPFGGHGGSPLTTLPERADVVPW